MAYATLADLVPQRITAADLAELTSEDDVPDEAVVQGALAAASARVDSYCGQRYKTPLRQSELIRDITLDLALFDLASRRRDTQPKETWSVRREMAISLLRDIASGKASLDQPEAAGTTQSSSADVTTPTTPQVFTDDALRGFC